MNSPIMSKGNLNNYIAQEFPHMEKEIEALCMFIQKGTELQFFSAFIHAVNENNGERNPFNLYKTYSSGKEATTENETADLPDISRLVRVNYLSTFGSFRHLLAVATAFIKYAEANVPFTILESYNQDDWICKGEGSDAFHKRWPNLYHRAGTMCFFIKDGVNVYRPDEYLEKWELFNINDIEVVFPIIPTCERAERLFGVDHNPVMMSSRSKEYFDKHFLNYYLEKTFLRFGDMIENFHIFKEETLKAGADLFVNEFLIKDYPKLPERLEIRKTTIRIFKEGKDYEELYVALMIYKSLQMLLKAVPKGDSYVFDPDYQIVNLSFGDFGGKKALVVTEDNRTIAIGSFTEKDKVVSKFQRLIFDFKFVKTNAMTVINEVLLK